MCFVCCFCLCFPSCFVFAFLLCFVVFGFICCIVCDVAPSPGIFWFWFALFVCCWVRLFCICLAYLGSFQNNYKQHSLTKLAIVKKKWKHIPSQNLSSVLIHSSVYCFCVFVICVVFVFCSLCSVGDFLYDCCLILFLVFCLYCLFSCFFLFVFVIALHV